VLTPTSVILEATFQWKKKRVFIPSNSDIVPPPHSILTLMSPIYLLPGSSNQALTSTRVEDIFSNLKLDHASFCFLILSEEKKGTMKTIL